MRKITQIKDSDYYLTSDGQVISLRQTKPKVLKAVIDNNGYKRVTISGKTVRIHRAVAIYFIPNPENKPTVNHIDGNKLNNDISNLEWATSSEQMQHVFANKLSPKCSKFNEDMIRNIKKDMHTMSPAKLREKYPDYNITSELLNRIRYKKSWGYV